MGKYGLPLAFVWLYLYSFPYFPEIHSANELPRVYLTRAMVEEGTFAIDSGVARWGTTVDVSQASGHHYSNKAPGSSFLAVPAYLALRTVKALWGAGEPTLAEMLWAFRVTTGVVPTLLFLILLYRFLARFVPTARARRMGLCGYGLGSMALTYSILFISHQLSAVCIATAYILIVWVVEDGRDARLLIVAGFAAGCAPLVDYQAAFAGVPVAVYLLWHLLVGPTDRRDGASTYRSIALASVGAVPPVALLLLYHYLAFGSPLATGYDYSQTFAHFHQKGFLGMTELRWDAFAGSTIAPDNGLLVFCPMLVLAVPGWVVMVRRKLYWHVGVTVSVVVIYLLFISSINFWRGGWQIGPRYITAMLPFAMVPVTVAIHTACRYWPARAAAVALVTVSVVVYSVSCAVFPHFPEKFKNPLYEVIFRLIWHDLAPYNVGWIFGLSGLASLLPCFVVLAAVLLRMAVPRRLHLRSGVVGLFLAALIVIGYSAFPGGGPRAERAYQWITTVMPN
ncbi:MAG: hypothetical protein MJE77_38695 [Proteobacteria bacterium]|nr:hypothetical protein [Pseudomonadota bacterium]